ncbi:MAG: hypothetical protein HY943_09425 [Gammaproteobacteria bacterium]|nr:hypothetical protein [Gammaproteobacteria bacterium]
MDRGKGMPVFFVKALVRDFTQGAEGIVTIPAEIESVYLEDSKSRSNHDALLAASASDIPGAKIYAFNVAAPSQMGILDAIISNDIKVAFNRHRGGADVKVPIDMSVTDTGPDGVRKTDAEQILKFPVCSTELIEAIKSDASRK